MIAIITTIAVVLKIGTMIVPCKITLNTEPSIVSIPVTPRKALKRFCSTCCLVFPISYCSQIVSNGLISAVLGNKFRSCSKGKTKSSVPRVIFAEDEMPDFFCIGIPLLKLYSGALGYIQEMYHLAEGPKSNVVYLHFLEPFPLCQLTGL